MLVRVCRALGQAECGRLRRFRVKAIDSAKTQARRILRVEWAKGVQMPKSASSFVARLVIVGCSLAALACPRLVQAQAAEGARVQHEVFDDDLLTGDLERPFGARVFTGHLPPARTRLIRPRANFLPELYRSVEHL
jgi:hypothetical protein